MAVKSAVTVKGMVTDENSVPLKAAKKATNTATIGSKRTVLQELTNREKKPAISKGGLKKPVTQSDGAAPKTSALVASKPPVGIDALVAHAVASAASLDEAMSPFDEAMDVDESEQRDEQAAADVLAEFSASDEEEDDEDIDQYDHEDPQFCTEYVPYIFAHWKKLEVKDACSPRYMDKQLDITEKHRAILIDWMSEVIVKFRLMAETMFLAVSIIDRFLQVKAVARQKLQLVGVTAMLIASKFEEIYTPEVNDFIWITAKAYTREEMLKMERLILVTLEFNLAVATPLHFLRRFSKAARSDSRIHTLSKYITELSLLEYNMLEFLPSHVAAAAVYIARRMTVRDHQEPVIWTRCLVKHSGYTEQQIMPCVLALNEIVKNATKYKASHRKYACPKLLSVADIPAVNI